MSNFAYKYEIKKISLTEVRLGLHFPRYVVDEILSFVNEMKFITKLITNKD